MSLAPLTSYLGWTYVIAKVSALSRARLLLAATTIVEESASRYRLPPLLSGPFAFYRKYWPDSNESATYLSVYLLQHGSRYPLMLARRIQVVCLTLLVS